MPYAFLGVIGPEKGVQEALISRGDALFIAKKHDVLEGAWRVDGVSAAAVEVTYLPLNAHQIITNEGTAP